MVVDDNGKSYKQISCLANSRKIESTTVKFNSKPSSIPPSDDSNISDWSTKTEFENAKGMGRKDKNMPDFNLKEIADLMDHAQIISKIEQPKWRKAILEEKGPTGTDKAGYTDISKLFYMKWEQADLGRLYFDVTRTIFFDGTKFMMRTKGGNSVK